MNFSANLDAGIIEAMFQPPRQKITAPRTHAGAHGDNNSRACLRVVAVISIPPNMRATSSTRALASSTAMRDAVLPLPDRPLLTWKWAPA